MEKQEKPKSKFRLKLENFWYHYKWHTIAAVFILAAGSFALKELVFSAKPDLTVLMSSNLYISDAQILQLKANIAEYVEDFNGDGKVEVHFFNLTFPGQKSDNSAALFESAQARLAGELATNDCMLFIFNTTVYRQQKVGEGMEDLTTIFPQLELENPKQLMLSDTGLLEGQVFYHFPETMFITMRDRDMFLEYRGEKYISRLDNAQKTLERIINGEKVKRS